MQRTSILSVGHGLCVVLGQSNDTFVFDCGEHTLRWKVPLSWKRLVDRSVLEDEISSMAVSHLHFDHYCGFLAPLPNVRSDVNFYIGQMPSVDDDPGLGAEFVLRLMTIAPLDPKYGPLDLDLTRRVRKYAPDLNPVPVSRGHRFSAGREDWTVLWPPSELRPSDWNVKCVRQAITAYDEAAEQHDWLAERLDRMRRSDTFRSLLETLNDDKASVSRDERRHDESPGSRRTGSDSKQLLVEAGRLLRKAANHLSLILLSDSGVLLTGDATKSAMNRALRGCLERFSVVVTPHHGGREHVPRVVKQQLLQSDVWVSSAGDRLSPHVSEIYDSLTGEHYRTDYDGDVEILLDHGSVYHVATRYRPWFVNWY